MHDSPHWGLYKIFLTYIWTRRCYRSWWSWEFSTWHPICPFPLPLFPSGESIFQYYTASISFIDCNIPRTLTNTTENSVRERLNLFQRQSPEKSAAFYFLQLSVEASDTRIYYTAKSFIYRCRLQDTHTQQRRWSSLCSSIIGEKQTIISMQNQCLGLLAKIKDLLQYSQSRKATRTSLSKANFIR